MTDKERQRADARLRDLWARHDRLDQGEWAELYEIVTRALMAHRSGLLQDLEKQHKQEKSDLVQDFFLDKVYGRIGRGACDHLGALHKFFENFLLDRMRQVKRRRAQEGGDLDDVVSIATAEPSPDDAEVLAEVGLSPERVAAAARDWLHGLGEAQDWIPIFLGRSWCPDHGEPLSRLARRLGIASHHYKAKKLGITHKGEDVNPEGFSKTLLGGWLAGLGLPPDPDHRAATGAALKILCVEALSWVNPGDNERGMSS